MQNKFGGLNPGEKLKFTLRGIYESFGYKRIHSNRFESYDLYLDNKSFLNTDKIISFTDLDGRLLALKPDVTLSIANKLPDGMGKGFEKLYYHEKVCRLSEGGCEYREINQTGVEVFGPIDGFCRVEVIALALASLQEIGKSFLLDVSHMGFVDGLLEQGAVDPSVKGRIYEYIHQKNTHDLARLLSPLHAQEEWKQKVLKLPLLYGPFDKTLKEAGELAGGEQMEQALTELYEIWEAFKDTQDSSRLCIDFSIVNDLDYYNGVIFQGYLENLPGIVLSGGNYDNLTKKLGKQCGAIGFAVYMDVLAELLTDKKPEPDVLIVYGGETDYAGLLKEIRALQGEGLSVRAEHEESGLPLGKACYRFEGGKLCPCVKTGGNE